MVRNARFGSWETNSSSYHQLAIRTVDTELVIPESLVIRGNGDLETWRSRDWGPQEKLDLLVDSLCWSSGQLAIYGIHNVKRILEETGVEVTVDYQSFKDHYAYETSIGDDLVRIATGDGAGEIGSDKQDYTKMLLPYLFDSRSRFVSCDANYRDTAAADRGFVDRSDRITGAPNPDAENYTVYEDWC